MDSNNISPSSGSNTNQNHPNNNAVNAINHSTKNADKNNLNFPCITDNKKIFIHKPSDFTKNKYTYLGSLANNSELLSLESRKTLHSPRFSMKDIKQQINRENKIIGSILKDEVNSLPRLLKNYSPWGCRTNVTVRFTTAAAAARNSRLGAAEDCDIEEIFAEFVIMFKVAKSCIS